MNKTSKDNRTFFNGLLDSAPKTYYAYCDGEATPKWIKADFTSNDAQNERLIKDIYYLNKIKREKLGSPSSTSQGPGVARL